MTKQAYTNLKKLQEIEDLIKEYTKEEPYISNTVQRIRLIVEK